MYYGTAVAFQVCSGGDAQVQEVCAPMEFSTAAPEHTHPTVLLSVGGKRPFLNCRGTSKGDTRTVHSYCVFVLNNSSTAMENIKGSISRYWPL